MLIQGCHEPEIWLDLRQRLQQGVGFVAVRAL